jgi:hypothetical protein
MGREGPALFLTGEGNLLRHAILCCDTASDFISDSVVRTAIDVEVAVKHCLWSELEPLQKILTLDTARMRMCTYGVISIHHQNKVIILARGDALKVMLNAGNLGNV